MPYSHFTLSMRQTLEGLSRTGRSMSEIARRLGVHRSTVKRELERNGCGEGKYEAYYAHKSAMHRKKRPEGNRPPRRALVRPAAGRILNFERGKRSQGRMFSGTDRSVRIYRKRKYTFNFGRIVYRKPLTAYQKWCRKDYLKGRLRLHDWENRWRAKRDWHTIHWIARFRHKRKLNYVYQISCPAEPVLSRINRDPLSIYRLRTLRPAFEAGYTPKIKNILEDQDVVAQEKIKPQQKKHRDNQKNTGTIKKMQRHNILYLCIFLYPPSFCAARFSNPPFLPLIFL